MTVSAQDEEATPAVEPIGTPAVSLQHEPETKEVITEQSGWELWIPLEPVAASQSLAIQTGLSTAALPQNVEISLQSNQAMLKGQGDADQLRSVLFDQISEYFDFLGGVVELTVLLPEEIPTLTLTLQARNTTGYGWEMQTGADHKYSQVEDTATVPRYHAIGAPALQTIQLQANGPGSNEVRLVYRRPFEPDEAVHARLTIWLAEGTNEVDLSDPTLQIPENLENANHEMDANPIEDLEFVKGLPAALDWRTSGIVPAVRNQGSCGSCWAFGTVGIMESAIKKAGLSMPDLSEQFLVSCNTSGWSCNGGLTAHYYHFDRLGQSQTQIGAVLETVKPYTATNGTCSVAYDHPYQLSDWEFVTGSEWTVPTVAQIKTAIYTYGPITAGVCVGDAFSAYSGGVFQTNETVCGGYTNHQIILVGWDDATQTWILRNSWGTYWGENGYMRIKYGTSRVGEGTSWVTYTPESPPATTTNTTIGGALVGSYPMASPSSQEVQYALDGGPVVIQSDNGSDIVASLNQWRRPTTTGGWTGVTQSMALPIELISNKYVLPRYNDFNDKTLYQAVLMANVDTVSRDITVTIGGTTMGTYTLGPSESRYEVYNIVGGPIVVSSVEGAKIVASLYELKRAGDTDQWNGQSEMMGVPQSMLSDKYLIPIYFGNWPTYLDASIVFANADTRSTTIEVYIGGELQGSYPMPPNTSQVVRYALDGGPVLIQSNDGAKIVASLNQWRRPTTTGGWTGVTQSMALQYELISNKYFIPRYDDFNNKPIYQAVLMANVDTVSRDITVKIGSTTMGTYTLGPSESRYEVYDIVGGPIVVSAVEGAKIVASLYELKRAGDTGQWNGQSEMMGVPQSLLSDTYLIPIYFGNWPTYLDASINIGVP